MVQTVYDDRILLSCEAADKLIALVKSRMQDNALFDGSAGAAEAEENDD